MASAVAGGVFNAFAFAGAGYVFKLFDKGGAAEMKRHDLAMEKLTRERDAWNEARLKEIDRVTALHHEQVVAEKDRQETLGDFRMFADVKEKYDKKIHQSQKQKEDLEKKIEQVNREFDERKPRLEYHPSAKMQNYVTVIKFLAVGAVSLGILSIVV